MINYIKKNFLQIISSVTNQFKKKSVQLLLENKPSALEAEVLSVKQALKLQKKKLLENALPPAEALAYTLSHARHDRIHCLIPGLFLNVRDGERKKRIELSYKYNDVSIKTVAPYQFGAVDLRVLQGLVALAGPDRAIISPNPETPLGKELRDKMELKDNALRCDVLLVRTSIYHLAKEIGYPNPGSSETSRIIQNVLENIYTISCLVQSPRGKMGFHLLSYAIAPEGENRLAAALNPLITMSILGITQHTRIDMNEVRAIKLDATRLIHQRLCAWLDSGESKQISMNTLCEYVWGDVKVTGSTLRMRHQRMEKSLKEFENLGWKVIETTIKNYRITRPKYKK